MALKKFKLLTGNDASDGVEREVLGYECPIQLPVLKTFTVKINGGWLIADQATGAVVGGSKLVATEKDAIDNFISHLNTFGEQAILDGIKVYLKRLKENPSQNDLSVERPLTERDKPQYENVTNG